MDENVERKWVSPIISYLGIKPCWLPGSQLPTCGDVVGIIEEKTLDIFFVSFLYFIKKNMHAYNHSSHRTLVNLTVPHAEPNIQISHTPPMIWRIHLP